MESAELPAESPAPSIEHIQYACASDAQPSRTLLKMTGSIFLTGATGYLGSRLLSCLTADGNRRIVCLCRRKPADCPSGNVEFVQGNLLDREDYADAIAGCDTVVHLAAATGKHAPAEYMRINRDGTEALAIEARRAGVQRFLYVSTIAVKFLDKSRYPYAQSKEQAEGIVVKSGLRWVIARPTLILGKNAPGLISLSRLAGLPIVPVFGDGRTLVQPVFVDDLAACLAAILKDDRFEGQTIEIGGPEVLSIEDLLLSIRRARGGRGWPVMHLPARPIAACLGWMEPFLRPLLPFTAGQLASFSNVGTIDPDPWVEQQQVKMKSVDEMLQSVANEQSPA
jgi:nucleoside-diphosphate-sugar epimerase